ncbi:MAG: lipopolysaccharide biosynthesis protein, partial [Pseudomonadota bacterium]
MAAMNSLGLQALLDKLVSVKGELAWVILGQVLAFSGGIVTIKVLTNMMGAANYGVLALGLTIAGFMNMFIYGPIGQAVSRFFSIYRERDKVETYYGLVWQSHGWAFVLVAVLAVAGAVLSGIVADRRWGVIILVAAAFGMIGGWNGTAFNMLSAMRKRKIAALSQGIESWVRLFIAILAIYLVGGSGGAVLAGYVIGALLVFIAIATTSDDVGKVMMQRKEPRGLPWKLSYGMREYLKYAGAFSM